MEIDYFINKYSQQIGLFDKKEEPYKNIVPENRPLTGIEESFIKKEKTEVIYNNTLFEGDFKDRKIIVTNDGLPDELPPPSYFPEITAENSKVFFHHEWDHKKYNKFREVYFKFYQIHNELVKASYNQDSYDEYIQKIRSSKISKALPFVKDFIKSSIRNNLVTIILNKKVYNSINDVINFKKRGAYPLQHLTEALEEIIKDFYKVQKIYKYLDSKFDKEFSNLYSDPEFKKQLLFADKVPEVNDKLINSILKLSGGDVFSVNLPALFNNLSTLKDFYKGSLQPLETTLRNSKDTLFGIKYNNFKKEVKPKAEEIYRELYKGWEEHKDYINSIRNHIFKNGIDDFVKENKPKIESLFNELNNTIKNYINIESLAKMIVLGRFGNDYSGEDSAFDFKTVFLKNWVDSIPDETIHLKWDDNIEQKLSNIIKSTNDINKINDDIKNISDYETKKAIEKTILYSYSGMSFRDNPEGNEVAQLVDSLHNKIGGFTFNDIRKHLQTMPIVSSELKNVEAFFKHILDIGEYYIIKRLITDIGNLRFIVYIAKLLKKEGGFTVEKAYKMFEVAYEVFANKINRINNYLPESVVSEENLVDLLVENTRSSKTFSKDLERLENISQQIHNSGANINRAKFQEILNNKNSLFVGNRDIATKFNSLIIKIIGSEKSINKFKEKYKPLNEGALEKGIIKPGFFQRVNFILKVYKENLEINPSHSSFEKIKSVILETSSDIDVLSQFDSFKEHFTEASLVAKDKNLYKLDLQIDDKLRFRVLRDLDPKHFQVGVETQCCQSPGGVGEAAMIDSFINPVAGVVILEYKDRDGWETAAQSYFHYVPKDNGYILDNVEVNQKYTNTLPNGDKLNMEAIYAHWAATMKDKLDVSYIQAGTGYSGISKNQFYDIKSYKDPRSFAVGDPYKDWKPGKNIDLTKFKAKNQTLMETPKKASNVFFIEKLAEYFYKQTLG
jgi:hypothetical protein